MQGSGWAMRAVRVAGALLGVAALTACASRAVDGGAPPSPAKPTTDTASVAPAPSPAQSLIAGEDELSFDAAASAGAVRTDALEVTGAAEVTTNGNVVPFTARIVIPDTLTPDTVDVAVGGTCTTRAPGPATLSDPLSVPAVGASASVELQVAVPAGQETCDVVVEAWVPGATYTGGNLTTTFANVPGQ